MIEIAKEYKLVSRESNPSDHVINIGKIKIGGDNPTIFMAGPCSVEPDQELMIKIGEAVKAKGANIFRAGAFKPRTSPYAHQGYEEEGLKILAKVREKTGLLIVTEVMDSEDIPLVDKYADILQVGARNCQNYSMLRKLGKLTKKPILLKRGFSTTMDELILSAEYIVKEGNPNVMICLRGIRTFEDHLRNTPDTGSIGYLKKETNIPIIFDPSHAAGRRDIIESLSREAIAAGADGLIIETHIEPDKALTDAKQTIDPETLGKIISYARKHEEVFGRKL